MSITPVEVFPLTPERWDDLSTLFGPAGGDGGCWCMYWRLTQSEYRQSNGERNKEMLRALTEAGKMPGLLAYASGQAVGWCGVSPRPAFERLQHSRFFTPTTDVPTWSIVCFFIHHQWRGQGVGAALLNGAVQHAARNGAKAIEAFPVNPQGAELPPWAASTGTLGMFLKAGFREITTMPPASGGYARSIVRYDVPDEVV